MNKKKPKSTGMCGHINIRERVTMPIRDMANDGEVAFLVDVYGWTAREIATVPGGSAPLKAAVQRLGLDTDRYRGVLWDAPV